MPELPTQRTITKAEYLQVVGLLTLSKMHNERLTEIIAALEKTTGEGDLEYMPGHCSDAATGQHDYNADALLSRLDITVAE